MPLISDSNEQLTGLDTLYFLMDIHPLGTLTIFVSKYHQAEDKVFADPVPVVTMKIQESAFAQRERKERRSEGSLCIASTLPRRLRVDVGSAAQVSNEIGNKLLRRLLTVMCNRVVEDNSDSFRCGLVAIERFLIENLAV